MKYIDLILPVRFSLVKRFLGTCKQYINCPVEMESRDVDTMRPTELLQEIRVFIYHQGGGW